MFIFKQHPFISAEGFLFGKTVGDWQKFSFSFI